MMKTYELEIHEILARIVKVKAESEEQAIEKVQEMYDNEEIVLDWSNCVSSEIDFVREIDNKLNNENVRRCSECGKSMVEGYCIDNGMEYYCNSNCLYKHYTDEEWADLYATGDSYWTEWEDDE